MYSLEPSQVEFIAGRLNFMGDSLFYKHFVGYIGEWDLSSGVLVDHNFHDGEVFRMSLSGDKIVTCNKNAIRVFNISSCLLVLLSRLS